MLSRRILLLAVALFLLATPAHAETDLLSLAQDLAGEDPVRRRAASRALVFESLRVDSFRDGLMRGLGDPDPVIALRCRAILALAKAADSDELLELRGRVRFGEPTARKTAIEVLRDLGSGATPAVPALVSALRDSDRGVRESAAIALGMIGPGASDAVPALIAYAEISHGDFSAPQALSGIGRGLVDAMPLLLAELDHPSLTVREAILGLLVRIGPSTKVASVFRKLLDHKEARLRIHAVWGLPAAAPLDPATVSALTTALDDRAPRVRELAARGLGALGLSARGAGARLTALLKDPDLDVCREAARALARVQLPGAGAPEALAKLLEADDEALLAVALQSLAHLGPPETIVAATLRIEAGRPSYLAPLARTARWRASPAERLDLRATLQIIRDGGPFAPEAKADFFARARAPDAPLSQMIEIYREKPASHVGGILEEAIGQVPPAAATPEALALLVAWSRDEAPWGPKLALEVIAQLGPAAAPLASELLSDLDAFKDDRPLHGLAGALAAIGQPVLQGLFDRLSGEFPQRAAQALAGMGRLAAPAAPLLVARARSGEVAALEALEYLGPIAKEAVHDLAPLLEWTDAELPVRAEDRSSRGAARYRIALVRVLGRTGFGGPGLSALLTSEDRTLRVHAAEAMLLSRGVTAGDCPPLAVLLELAATRAPRTYQAEGYLADSVQWLAVRALGNVGPGAAEATPLLYRLLLEAQSTPRFEGPNLVGQAAYAALHRIWGG